MGGEMLNRGSLPRRGCALAPFVSRRHRHRPALERWLSRRRRRAFIAEPPLPDGRRGAIDPTILAFAPSGIAVAKGSISAPVPCVLVRRNDASLRDCTTDRTETDVARVASAAPFRKTRAGHDESSGSLHVMRTSHDVSADLLRIMSTARGESAASLAGISTALDVSDIAVDVSDIAVDVSDIAVDAGTTALEMQSAALDVSRTPSEVPNTALAMPSSAINVSDTALEIPSTALDVSHTGALR